MAPKKTQPTLAPAPPAVAPAPVANDILLQKRDALVTALQQLSNSALQVSWATQEFFNLQYPQLGQLQAASGLIVQRAQSMAVDAAQAQDAEPTGKRQKKKEKKIKDPLEPKRPVTAYFLFLANARPQLQKDMKDATPKEIQMEAVNKWYAMSDAEKQPYKDLYEANYAKWKTDMEDYKAKKRADEGIADEEPDTTAGFTAVNDAAAAPIASAAAAAAVAAVEAVDTSTETEKRSRAKSTPKKPATEKKEKTTGRASERKKKDSAKEAANKETETPSKKADDGKRKRKRGKA